MKRLPRFLASIPLLIAGIVAGAPAPSVAADGTNGHAANGYAQLGEPAPTVKLTLDDEHVLKEFILNDPDVPKVSKDMDLSVRAEVPREIPLLPFRPEITAKVPQLKAHQYFVHGKQIVIVNSARMIADVVD